MAALLAGVIQNLSIIILRNFLSSGLISELSSLYRDYLSCLPGVQKIKDRLIEEEEEEEEN